MSWPYAHHDASYVIGALFPAEHRGFEQHLTDSDSCARAVTEVAGLPGLLARVDATELDPPAVEDALPDTLLPTLLRQVRRRQRRRTLATAGLAAAASAVIGSPPSPASPAGNTRRSPAPPLVSPARRPPPARACRWGRSGRSRCGPPSPSTASRGAPAWT